MGRMPVLFVGHGSPMNAIEDNEFSRAWIEAGRALPRPKAILCVSAHWETEGTRLTAMERPRTIHDFSGFPSELHAMSYPAQGSPVLAARIKDLLEGDDGVSAGLDSTWGLDHGAWSVLVRLFPKADIPVVQLSLDTGKNAREHYELGRMLKFLRDEGVLILGSGNIVHNLRMVVFKDTAYEWALSFDAKVGRWIEEGKHEPIIGYEGLGSEAELSINSAEHFKPLLYVLGAMDPGEPVSFFAAKVWGGSLSMRSLRTDGDKDR
jgi:4,5-DOPA dioxygenase extradiol